MPRGGIASLPTARSDQLMSLWMPSAVSRKRRALEVDRDIRGTLATRSWERISSIGEEGVGKGREELSSKLNNAQGKEEGLEDK